MLNLTSYLGCDIQLDTIQNQLLFSKDEKPQNLRLARGYMEKCYKKPIKKYTEEVDRQLRTEAVLNNNNDMEDR